jgi:hypothetical protein
MGDLAGQVIDNDTFLSQIELSVQADSTLMASSLSARPYQWILCSGEIHRRAFLQHWSDDHEDDEHDEHDVSHRSNVDIGVDRSVSASSHSHGCFLPSA